MGVPMGWWPPKGCVPTKLFVDKGWWSIIDWAAAVLGCFFLICSLSLLIEVNPDSQLWHRNGRSPECWKRCLTREFLWRNCNLQTWQVNCFSVRWTCKNKNNTLIVSIVRRFKMYFLGAFFVPVVASTFGWQL